MIPLYTLLRNQFMGQQSPAISQIMNQARMMQTGQSYPSTNPLAAHNPIMPSDLSTQNTPGTSWNTPGSAWNTPKTNDMNIWGQQFPNPLLGKNLQPQATSLLKSPSVGSMTSWQGTNSYLPKKSNMRIW